MSKGQREIKKETEYWQLEIHVLNWEKQSCRPILWGLEKDQGDKSLSCEKADFLE